MCGLSRCESLRPGFVRGVRCRTVASDTSGTAWQLMESAGLRLVVVCVFVLGGGGGEREREQESEKARERDIAIERAPGNA